MEKDSSSVISKSQDRHDLPSLRRPWEIPLGTDYQDTLSDTTLFSSSLPVLIPEKRDSDGSECCDCCFDDNSLDSSKLVIGDEEKDHLEDFESNHIKDLLPGDEAELFTGIPTNFDFNESSNQLEDFEECDFFGSGGGMELDAEPQGLRATSISNTNFAASGAANSSSRRHFPTSVGTVSGEHPFGEHPSRTLFVRNINSNVEDSELRSHFEQYGEIRSLYTVCKYRGFVMISYYDIRAARNAMRGSQNKPLRGRNLDIHFSIPKDNPSEKDINQGTLVVFNLDPSVSNNELLQIFGALGEVKEIRETPNKRHHKFVEYYDIRDAEAALKALNRSEIAGKRIKLEHSRPGGTRRSPVQLLGRGRDQYEAPVFHERLGSPVANSSPGNWTHFGSPFNHKPLHAFGRYPGLLIQSLSRSNKFHQGLASVLASSEISPDSKSLGRSRQRNHTNSTRQSAYASLLKQSLLTPKQELLTSSSPTSVFSETRSSDVGRLSGPQFLWGSPPLFLEHDQSVWSMSASNRFSFSGECVLGFGGGDAFRGNDHVGSAPSRVHLDGHMGYSLGSPGTSLITSYRFGNVNRDDSSYMLRNDAAHASRNPGSSLIGNQFECNFHGSGMTSMPKPLSFEDVFHPGFGKIRSGGFLEHGKDLQSLASGSHIIDWEQFKIDVGKIASGEDARTTLMITNIPNKYTSKMLQDTIDEKHGGTYDFLSLPIDLKNRCNMGYALINMVSPLHIISFYQTFNRKRWEKFSSEKIASLSYAQVQGKAALASHFENCIEMIQNEKYQPIPLSDGQESSDQVQHTPGRSNIYIYQLHRPSHADPKVASN